MPLCTSSGVCQSSMMPNTSLPVQGEKGSSENHTYNTSVENPIMVSISTGTPGGLPSEDSSPTRPSSDANGAGVPNATRSAPVDRLAYLRQSYASRGISSQSSLHHGGEKTNSDYGSSFSKWASWCQQRGRDPLTGLIEDVVNFLAELHAGGYKYQSLNVYRSATSSRWGQHWKSPNCVKAASRCL